MYKHLLGLAVLIAGLMLGCGPLNPAERPENIATVEALPPATTGLTTFASQPLLPFANPACAYPDGWQSYTVLEGENADSLAARWGLSLETLLTANCLVSAQEVYTSRLIYLPIPPATTSAQTFLPLSISQFQPETTEVSAGGLLRLTWQAHGYIQTVRLGEWRDGLYHEIMATLPPAGTLELPISWEAQGWRIYLLQVSDGANSVVAQTSVHVACRETWFFQPAPSTCPSALLTTTFIQQKFERGVLLYIPTLRRYYVLVNGQEAVELEADELSPQTTPPPLPPAGLLAPSRPLAEVWAYPEVFNALGFALAAPQTYLGLFQCEEENTPSRTYLLAAEGHIYRFGRGLIWESFQPR